MSSFRGGMDGFLGFFHLLFPFSSHFSSGAAGSSSALAISNLPSCQRSLFICPASSRFSSGHRQSALPLAVVLNLPSACGRAGKIVTFSAVYFWSILVVQVFQKMAIYSNRSKRADFGHFGILRILHFSRYTQPNRCLGNVINL